MEFKGIKGPWFKNYTKGSWLIQDLESYQDSFKSAIAEVYYFDDERNTAEANALLISKAPGMLELHQSELKTLLDLQQTMHDREVSKSIIQEIERMIFYKEKLIKQATEL